MPRRLIGVAGLVGLATLCLLSAPRVDAAEAEVTVRIDNFTFSPADLTVAPGTTVTWVNADDIPHTVVGTEGAFRSKALDTEDTFSFTFRDPGKLSYFCSEVILLPVALFLVIRMIPAPLMAEFREEAQRRAERPTSRVAAAVIIALWITAIALTLWAFWPTPVP